MNENKRGIATNLKALDAHVFKPEEYEDIPELTDEELVRADLHEGGKLIRRGRPPSETRKQPVKIRLDRDLVAALRASGPGWQTRINTLLREAVLGARGVVRNTLVRKLKRELLGAKGVGIKRKLKRGLAKSEEMRATAKRRKDAARQHTKKAHLKKARA
jgi:uncharacterized protein (DUF4415 family)